MTAHHQDLAHSAAALRLRERIALSFGRSAAHYDEHAELQRNAADRLLTLLPTGEWQRVLDLGCGTGYCTQQLQQRLPCSTLLALDLAEPMLAKAREKSAANSVSLLCGNADALPLQSNSIDLVVSSLMLQWCGNPEKVFAEISRVLRSGGVALISTFGPATLRELRDAWATVNASHHSNDFTPATTLQQAAASAGLELTLCDETQLRHYASLQALAHELKGLGANVVSNPGSMTTPGEFKAASAAFARHRLPQGIPVQWQLFHLVLRKS